MNSKRILSHTFGLFLSLTFAAPVPAEEVRLFTQPPSADEMGKLLFPDKAAPAQPRTRSLTFTKADTPPRESVAIALPIQFDFNSAALKEETKPYLDEIGRMLTMEQFRQERLVIEGHTDAVGPESYNDWLSLERAKAVKNYLISRFPIDPNRLRIVGRGESRPLPGKDPYDPLNRRVELHRAE